MKKPEQICKLDSKSKEVIEAAIYKAMIETKIPGLSITCIKDDEIVYSKGFGLKNLIQSESVTTDSMYGIGSCSKSFTTLAILQLMEKGLLNLDDPIKKYLPINLDSKENPITIHHLMCHASGIPNLGVASITLARGYGFNQVLRPENSWEELYYFINNAKSEIIFKPGEEYYYFNGGFTLLQKIVEKVSGQEFPQYMKENVFLPLKMTRTTYLKKEFVQDSDIMTPYIPFPKDGGSVLTPVPPPFHEYVYGPGGIISTTVEQMNYIKMIYNGGTFEGKQILSPDSIEKWTTIHNSALEQTHPIFTGNRGYAYGWGIRNDYFGTKLVSHNGSTLAYGGNLALIPEKKIGVAIGVNCGNPPDIIIPIILGILMGVDVDKEYPIMKIPQKLNQLSGIYRSYEGFGTMIVKKEGAFLFLKNIQIKGVIEGDFAPIVPVKDDLSELDFYQYDGTGGKLKINFIISDSQQIHLKIERMLYHRVADYTPTN